ncbi:Hypothetical protein SCF082_LOCUS5298 [Durusdinium trenchii]|uniref:Uncharacterized protein n=1 Tax=Durusdinium trenchii TaxID=1381693 RepID=A0ABP0I522_9DINO
MEGQVLAASQDASPQEFANLVQTMATLAPGNEALHQAMEEAALRTLSPRSYGSDGARHPTFAFGIVHAFRLLGRLSPSLFQAAEGVCRDWAARKDRGRPSRLGRPAAGETAPQPHLLHDEQHVCVLAKPAGWTVSVSHSSGSEPVVLRQAQKGPQLQNWIMEKMENPIAMDVSAAHGLLHRLAWIPRIEER